MNAPQAAPQFNQLLQHAIELINQSRWHESLAAHYKLIDLDPNFALTYYGLGITHMRLGENNSARFNFEKCLQLDPVHANSHYYLGEIYLAENNLERAEHEFRAALRANNQHAAAINRLTALEGARAEQLGAGYPAPRPQPERPVYAPPPQRLPEPQRQVERVVQPSQDGHGLRDDEEFGVFGVLKRDTSAISRDVIGLIEQITMKRRPRISAHIGSIFTSSLSYSLLGVVLVGIPSVLVFRAPEFAIAGLLIGLIFGFFGKIIAIRSTTYLFDEGRLAISTGILFKRVHNFELYRVVDLELHQTLLNRITRDGSIVLHFEGLRGLASLRGVSLKGLAKKRELELVFKRLRSLVMLLRSHPYIKGIIR